MDCPSIHPSIHPFIHSFIHSFSVAQGWTERDVFGKVRYMNYNGCKRKFDIEAYVKKVDDMVAKVQKK